MTAPATTTPPGGTPVSWNNLFITWIEQTSKATTNSNLQNTYQKAIRSLKACPKKFEHPSELKELKFFGPSICKTLQTKYAAYCSEEGIPMPEVVAPPPPTTAPKTSKKRAATTTDVTGGPPARKKAKPWIPRFRSGGYAILLTLYHQDSLNPGAGMSKSAIVRLAEGLCDSSFKPNPNVGTFYSAWSSVNTLITNGVVFASASRMAVYYITDEGKLLAEKLLQAERESRPENPASDILAFASPGPAVRSASAPDFASPRVVAAATAARHQRIPDPSPNTHVRNQIAQMNPRVTSPTPTRGVSAAAAAAAAAADTVPSEAFQCQTWAPGSYSIKVIIDNREIRSSDDRDFFQTALTNLGVPASVDALAVGDVIWVAEHNTTKEIAVLDFILERKRLDDLVSSIKDGRFKEQKSRLKRSGLKNIIYLVEEPIGLDRSAYTSHIKTAMSQAIAVDNFFLKRTTSSEDTASYLARVSHSLQDDMYKNASIAVVWPNLDSTKTYIVGLQKARQEHESRQGCRLAVAFDSFQTAMSKSGMLTVRDVYIRMLMTIKGITLSKALAIQKIYTTPRALLDAYKSIAMTATPTTVKMTENEMKQMLFQKLGAGITRKKITKLLSEKVYQVWGNLN